MSKHYSAPAANIKAYVERKLGKDFYGTIYDWQDDASGTRPTALRLIAYDVEKISGKASLSIYYDAERIAKMKSEIEQGIYLTREKYIKARAINQSYLDFIGYRDTIMYRGTSGSHGVEAKNEFRQAVMDFISGKSKAKSVIVRDAPLSGYSLHEYTGHTWGLNKNGITVRRKIKQSEIFFHTDLMSGITGAFDGEAESILIGGEHDISFDDIVTNANVVSETGSKIWLTTWNLIRRLL